MLRKILVGCALVVSSSASSHEGSEHGQSSYAFSPCVAACLETDAASTEREFSTDLYLASVKEGEKRLAECKQQNAELHNSTLRIFMQGGRSKTYILDRVGNYFYQNSVAGLACLFGELFQKLEEGRNRLQDCLKDCEHKDFDLVKAEL